MTASTIPSIGIDFGGTSIKMGVVKGAEVIAHAPSIATQEYGNPDQLIEAIAQFVNMLRLNHPEVQAIGMGMPGFVNFYQGTVYTLTNVPGWNNVPVRDMLQAACGLPVYVENDANCMAYAEWKLGAGKGKRHLVCLTLGTGVAGIDMRRGVKVGGSRFYFLRGQVARMQIAMLTMAVDQAEEHGFTLAITPTLVRPEVMRGTGFLNSHADEIYRLREPDDQYLVGTSEVALAGMHENEILDLGNGPLRYCGWSSCYRREAGAAGKDTSGIIRVHQFDKVEMFVYAKQEDSYKEHEHLLAMEQEMLAKVEVPYRIIDTAAGDLGSSAARKFDCEAWVPTQGRYRELTSTSNCTEYQARRLNIRERMEDGGTRPVSTLNGTLATTRWLVAIMENHQQKDGSIEIPKAMRAYMGGKEVIEPTKWEA